MSGAGLPFSSSQSRVPFSGWISEWPSMSMRLRSIGPRSGSIDRNRTRAGTASSFGLADDRSSEPDAVAPRQPVVRPCARDHVEHVANALREQQPVQIGRELDQVDKSGTN